jgi:hypothetical protein
VLRPGFDPGSSHRAARPADEATMHGTPDLAARAADLAARVAQLVSGETKDLHEGRTTNLSAYLTAPAPRVELPSGDRAEQVRRTAARLAANAARGRTVAPRRSPEDEVGAITRGNEQNA